MKKFLILKSSILLGFILVFMTTSIYAQSKIKGNRDVKIEENNVPVFNTLSIGDDFDVVLVKSSYPSVTLEADSNLLPVIKYQVNDSILNFQVTKNIRSSKELKVTIRYTDKLHTIVLNGDVDVESENAVELPQLNLTMNDDAKIEADIVTDVFNFQNNNDTSLKFFTNCILKIESKSALIDLRENSNNILDINTENLKITAQNNADLIVEGFSYNLEIYSSNSSKVEGKNLLTNLTKVVTSEKSEVEINVTETVNIDASGSSKIELYGESKIIIDQMLNNSTLQKTEL